MVGIWHWWALHTHHIDQHLFTHVDHHVGPDVDTIMLTKMLTRYDDDMLPYYSGTQLPCCTPPPGQSAAVQSMCQTPQLPMILTCCGGLCCQMVESHGPWCRPCPPEIAWLLT